MTARISQRTAKLGIAAIGAALVFAGTSPLAFAQSSAPAAPATAAAPAAPAAGGDAARIAKGKQLFTDFGCGSCHSLADAGATGHVGPAFDGNTNLSPSYIVNRVTNGSGPMPAFGDQMSQDDIQSVAAYIMASKAK